MYCHIYLRNGTIYVPTVAKTEAGFYMNVEPVAVVSVANGEGLRNALDDALARGNALVPTPKRNAYPPSLLPKYAGVKTDRAFMQGASHWAIDIREGNYSIVGYRIHKDGYWVEDATSKIDLSPSSTVEDVVKRMIAILQQVDTPKS